MPCSSVTVPVTVFVNTIAGAFLLFVLSLFLLFFLGGSERRIDPSHVFSTPGTLHPLRFPMSITPTKRSSLQVEGDCLAQQCSHCFCDFG